MVNYGALKCRRRRWRQDLEAFRRKQHHPNLPPPPDRTNRFPVPAHIDPARIPDLHFGYVGCTQSLGLTGLEDTRKDILSFAGNRKPSGLGSRQIEDNMVYTIRSSFSLNINSRNGVTGGCNRNYRSRIYLLARRMRRFVPPSVKTRAAQ